MRLIWTKSKSPLSFVIRWAFNEDVSHFAIILDERIVFHSNLLGVHLQWFETFKKSSEVVYSLSLKTSEEKENEVYFELIKHDKRPYDWGAFVYLAWRGFLFRFFSKPIPTGKNPLGSDRLDLCLELASALKPVLNIRDNLDMVTPFKLYTILKPQVESCYADVSNP